MRYADSGGVAAKERVRREALRIQAAELFASGVSAPEVARQLRVTPKSAYQWRRDWTAGGTAALASKGPGGQRCRDRNPGYVHLAVDARAGCSVVQNVLES